MRWSGFSALALALVVGTSGMALGLLTTQDQQLNPDRIGLPLPDGSYGWMNRKALSPPSIDGLDLAAGQARLEHYEHRLIPVTKTVDPKSKRIGYYLITAGFVRLAITRTPGFSVDALIAHGRCIPELLRSC
jgi:hypothetical protein